MPLVSLEDFSAISFEPAARFLGCDVGEKTIGLALSDTRKIIATPLSVIKRTQWKVDAVTLLKEIDSYKVGGVIVGFPLNMNGTEGPRCQATRQFVANLLKIKDLPVSLWDERLSTSAVMRTLLEADVSRAKRKPLVDKMAASYILQGFLDAFGRQVNKMK